MSLARLVVTAVLVEGRSKSEVARDYRVSRTWVHELVARYERDGEAGLQPRSRRPRSSPHQIDQTTEERIVELRKELTDLGLDAGAATIAAHLQRETGHSPAVSTIWRILTRRGFITPQPRKRPKSSFVRFEADQPNERWQADTTHWQLADGTGVEILDIIDDHSRLAIACVVRRSFKGPDVVEVFTDAFARHGLPAAVLTDNAAIFTGSPRRHGKIAFERHLETLHIRLIHSRAYHPQTCGKVERFHQTLKKWLTAHDPTHDLDQLQTLLDDFAQTYNTLRPHRSLGRRTPTEVYAARPKSSPDPDLEAAHWRIRHDVIDTTGVVTLRHNSRLHHIGIGRAHKGVRVLMLVKDRHIRVITEDGELLRELTLDPTRDYQPQPPHTATTTP